MKYFLLVIFYCLSSSFCALGQTKTFGSSKSYCATTIDSLNKCKYFTNALQIKKGQKPSFASIKFEYGHGCFIATYFYFELFFNGKKGYLLTLAKGKGFHYFKFKGRNLIISLFNKMNECYILDKTSLIVNKNVIHTTGEGMGKLSIEIKFRKNEPIENIMDIEGGPYNYCTYIPSFYNYLLTLGEQCIQPLDSVESIKILKDYQSTIAAKYFLHYPEDQDKRLKH